MLHFTSSGHWWCFIELSLFFPWISSSQERALLQILIIFMGHFIQICECPNICANTCYKILGAFYNRSHCVTTKTLHCIVDNLMTYVFKHCFLFVPLATLLLSYFILATYSGPLSCWLFLIVSFSFPFCAATTHPDLQKEKILLGEGRGGGWGGGGWLLLFLSFVAH